jgi:ferredoxin-NADP reductase
VKSIRQITHNVLQIVTEKPLNYNYISGQSTEIAINKNGWKDEKRPFTFTSIPKNDFLEFTIKTYPSHNGVTNEFLQLEKDDILILHDVFGEISYKGEGLFIAGGAGVTPFISIFKDLQSKNEIGDNKLISANKNQYDMIMAPELKKLLGKNFINILSDEKTKDFAFGPVAGSFLKRQIRNSNKNIYLCGPPSMMDAIEKQLSDIGIDKEAITMDKF